MSNGDSGRCGGSYNAPIETEVAHLRFCTVLVKKDHNVFRLQKYVVSRCHLVEEPTSESFMSFVW
jgi:hypothetical protein